MRCHRMGYLTGAAAVGMAGSLGLAAASPAAAQQFTIEREGDQSTPGAAFLSPPHRSFMVVWEDDTIGAIEGLILTPRPPFQRGNADLGTVFTVSDVDRDVNDPSLAASGDGTALVTWEESTTALEVPEELGGPFPIDITFIKGALLAADGSTLQGPFTIGGSCDGDDASVAYNDREDSWLVAWNRLDFGNAGELRFFLDGLWSQIFGEPLPDPIPDPLPEFPDDTPQAVIDFIQAALDVLEECDEAPGIKGVIVSADATSFGPVFDVSPSGAYEFTDEPNAEYDSKNNEFLVVYEVEFEDPDTFEFSIDIHGQRVSASGDLLGDELVIADADEDENSPSLAYDQRTKSHLVVWERFIEEDEEDGVDRIEGRLVAGGTGDLGPTFFISDGTADQEDAAVGFTKKDFLVAWEDDRNNTEEASVPDDVFGQVVGKTGNLVGSNFLIGTVPDVDLDTPAEIHFNLACANNGLCLVLWEEEEDPEDDEEVEDVGGRLLFNP